MSRAVVLSDGADILVLGGLARGDVSTAAVERINPATGAGTRAGSLALAVHDAAGALLGGRSLVFGGGSSTTVPTVQAFTGQTATTVGRLPEPRSDVAAVVVGNRAYVLGGFDGTRLVPSVVGTTDGVTFTSAGQLAQPVRYPAVAVEGGYVWVIGGDLGTAENATTGGQTTDIQRFDPASGTTTVVGHLPNPLGHAAAVVFGHQLFVVGGRSGTAPSAQIWRVDTATGTVTNAGSLPGPRSDAGIVTVGGVAWMLGGELTSSASPLNTVVELRPGTS
ncbi:MAG TPA: kelch repeat-containing protein [Acidimicrobiales bacterium]|nr:kelch repeat-containing protein [Acidimicrobiales bacterium]